MKKLSAFLLAFFLPFLIFAQTVITLAGSQAYVQLPSGYNPALAYPCLAFLPGLGETNSGLPGLKVHGPFLYSTALADSSFPIIIVSIQPESAWGTNNTGVQNYLTALHNTYKISKMFVTGLSIGAQEWTNFQWGGVSNFKQIFGSFMFSTDPPTVAPYGTAVVQPVLFATDSAFYYGGVGTADPFYNSVGPISMLPIFDSIQAQHPFYTPYLDLWTGVGHSDPVWSDGYNPAWNSPSMRMSIYRKVMQLAPIGPPVVPPPGPGTQLTSVTAAQLATIAPTAGLTYYNSTTGKITVGNGTAWQ